MRWTAVAWLVVACGEPVVEAPIEVAATIDDADRELLRARATDHYRAGEWAAFVTVMEQVTADRPDAWVDRYNLACGYARAGRADDALAELGALTDAGMDYGMALDPDLASLRDRAEFTAMLDRLDALYPPVTTGTQVVALDDPLLFPEGITWDATRGRYLITSMSRGTITAVTPAGATDVVATLRAGAVGVSALGVHVDPARGLVWAVGTAGRNHEGFTPDQVGITGVFSFDLATMAPRGTFLRDGRDAEWRFNDLAVGADGVVWITGGPGLHRLGPDDAAPVRVLDLPPTNGIAFGADPSTLYVGTYEGLVWVDTATLAATAMHGPEGEHLDRFDGLVYADGSLVAIQYGSRWRVLQVGLSADGRQATWVRTLERGDPALAAATTGVMIGPDFHWIAGKRLTEAVAATLDENLRGIATQPVIRATPIDRP